ncbi:MAG: MarR family transcriptional regulator [Paludibacterium sp.]|uniref:MarR family winged helix-turn-helix transcriptional regulator n=1 Tax=Paludibacterium sp. TaxID=1917523 RepID=UPI0025D073C8|nr:MarR family transcriptional regulator [Paludibacterium sp.]MBV8047697.1 MarR family transcriptional regulator [Paludibacterium sp.]MBV8649648.1 MarR family transcriptional regulator [Paludibacterium sp.]
MSSQYERFSDALIYLLKNWRSTLDARFRPFGLSQARWHVLLKLLRASQSLAQCDLAERVGIEPASLVRLLDALEHEGLVRREADPQDRRAKRITLTEAGRALALELAAIADVMREELLGSIPPEALAQTIEVLESLQRRAASLQEAEPGRDA